MIVSLNLRKQSVELMQGTQLAGTSRTKTVSADRTALLQRKESLTTGYFQLSQFHDFGDRPADLHGGC